MVVPLLVGVTIVVLRRHLSRRQLWMLTLAASLAVVGLAAALLVAVHGGLHVYWFGGWTPRHGVVLGVSFTVDSFAAIGALFAGVLVSAVVLVGTRVESFGPLAHALTLVLLAAAVGFCLTGDLFNLFVFFELMSVCTIALLAVNTGDLRALRAALHFAIVNSIGAFFVLIGIALLYARTGALNLAVIGQRLAAHPTDQLVVTAFALILVGFLVKAAIVPFHFWLVDAATAATAPVAMLLVGLLDTLGLYAVARVYWTVFSGPLHAHLALVQAVLIAAGVTTAILGALLCLVQPIATRRLAFVSISHSGLALIAVGLLNPVGLAGFGIYACADGATKAALFALVRAPGRDRGHGQGLVPGWSGGRVGAVLVVLAAVALAGLPPGGTFLAKGLIEDGASGWGRVLLSGLVLVVSAVTASAVLRLVVPRRAGVGTEVRRVEPAATAGRWSLPLLAAAGLLVGAFVLGVVPGLGARSVTAATRVEDRSVYAATVVGVARPASPSGGTVDLGLVPVVLGIAATAAAWGIARRPQLGASRGVRSPDEAALATPLQWMQQLHRGGIGDSAAWLTFGTATIGAVLALGIR